MLTFAWQKNQQLLQPLQLHKSYAHASESQEHVQSNEPTSEE